MIYMKLILFVLLILSSFFGPYYGYLNHIPSTSEKVLNVTYGESINKTISKISNLNSINKVFIKIYLSSKNITKFQAGEYEIIGKTLNEIIDNLNIGKTITHKLKIKEGMNIYQINELLDNSYLINDCNMLNCIKTNFNFKEGILYPDTYYYKRDMLASNILQGSHNRLKKYLNEIFMNKNISNNLKKDEILILASIIEKEAGNEAEKIKISSVFLSRLSINMRLQADPTIIYGLLPNFDGDIKKSDILDKNNKYNTYMINGLPPTPISIVSINSISAAANAEIGEYLYFVADTPNSHYFSKTYQEHLNKINQLGLNK
ncbi:MAG: hypothetical protein CMD46_03050 [Gammaproteobacteria bacterium]|nr:hypothetical protein [Gammaproteobacteria bacterium]